MQPGDARELLGLGAADATISQVKAAYRRKVMECHPDRVTSMDKSHAEAQFKLVTEAYKCLLHGGGGGRSVPFSNANTGMVNRRQRIVTGLPYLVMVVGTVSFGAFVASRKYMRDCQAARNSNPFLP